VEIQFGQVITGFVGSAEFHINPVGQPPQELCRAGNVSSIDLVHALVGSRGRSGRGTT
jgi:hypothetical protein